MSCVGPITNVVQLKAFQVFFIFLFIPPARFCSLSFFSLLLEKPKSRQVKCRTEHDREKIDGERKQANTNEQSSWSLFARGVLFSLRQLRLPTDNIVKT